DQLEVGHGYSPAIGDCLENPVDRLPRVDCFPQLTLRGGRVGFSLGQQVTRLIRRDGANSGGPTDQIGITVQALLRLGSAARVERIREIKTQTTVGDVKR